MLGTQMFFCFQPKSSSIWYIVKTTLDLNSLPNSLSFGDNKEPVPCVTALPVLTIKTPCSNGLLETIVLIASL